MAILLEDKEMLQQSVVIGSGPAAWTAMLYLARAQLNPCIFTGVAKGGVRGGQLMITTEVENYPGFPNGITGPELMQAMEDQVKNYDITIIEEDVISVDLSSHPFTVNGTSTSVQSHSIIVATGAYAKRLTGTPGDVELWGKGVSACAVCDGALPIYRGKDLAVIGGGDSACEEALFLTKYANKVYICLRRDEFRASKIMEERAKKNSKIEIVYNHQVAAIEGDDLVHTLRLKHSQTGQEKVLSVGGVFYGLGHLPSVEFLGDQLEKDHDGFLIRQGQTSASSVPGVFLAGDVCDKRYKQAVTAAGMGCMAALDAEKWLGEHQN